MEAIKFNRKKAHEMPGMAVAQALNDHRVEAERIGSSTPMSTSTSSVSDDEIVADLFHLARTGGFNRLESLFEEAKRLYSGEPVERIKKCLRRLGEVLWDSDYQGYRSEYQQHRRPKAQGILRADSSGANQLLRQTHEAS